MRSLVRSAVPAMCVGAVLLPTGAHTAHAQEEKELGWFNTADFALVLTAGNSETSTLGLKNVLQHIWPRAELRIEAGGIRTESSLKTRTAVGLSVDDFVIEEDSESETTAESYWANARYDHAFSDAWFGYGFAGWERNQFAGFDNRYTLVGGLGSRLVDNDRTKLKVDLGATYTVQKDIIEAPGASDNFAGLRSTWDYLQKLTASTDFTSVLIVDESLDDTDDLRADFTNSIAVSMSDALALKTGLRLLWDNQPALTGVPLFLPDGTDTGQMVLTELDKLDTYITVALVVKM